MLLEQLCIRIGGGKVGWGSLMGCGRMFAGREHGQNSGRGNKCIALALLSHASDSAIDENSFI